MVRLAITDLDTGLFFDQGAWTPDVNLAQKFPDGDAVHKVVTQFNVRNAAAAFIDGTPPRVKGFFWLTSPNPGGEKESMLPP